MSQEIQVEVVVFNEEGLHARPAALLVQALQPLECQVYLSKRGEGEEVDAKSILGVMMLAAERGTKLLVRASGPDAGKAVEAISSILRNEGGDS
jgi:phosphocarrier protein